MARTWIIGDVHGRQDLLTPLLGLIASDHHDGLVFVGDLIDHGEFSAQVLQTVVAQRAGAADTVVLPGNHEEILHRVLFGPREARGAAIRGWLQKGGAATLRSFGIEPPAKPPERKADADRLRDDLLGRLDPFVRHWLEHRFEAPLWHDIGATFRVVHAGFRPSLPTARQKQADLLEIREPFLSAGRMWDQRIVIHGHTARREPRIEVLPARINVDVGAGKGIGLAALAVEGGMLRDAVVVRGDGGVLRGAAALRGRAETLERLTGTALGEAA